MAEIATDSLSHADTQVIEQLDQPRDDVSERTYVVGIPLAVTFEADGRIVLDFDLAEANDFDCADDTAWDDQATTDSDTLSAVLSTIRNHFALTLNSPA